MAGSGGTTVLETPPYVIALVFAFFLVITLSFEKLLHIVRHALQKRGKHGLVSAMSHMQNELMLLGVATLILLTFQSNIVSYCTNAKNYTTTWLDHVTGCSCCLTRTEGVSACYLAAKSCISNSTLSDCCKAPNDDGKRTKVCSNVFDTTTDWDNPTTQGYYTVDAATGDVVVTDTHRRQLLGGGGGGGPSTATQCYGRVQTGWKECGYNPSLRPAIGEVALHQIHLFIFIIALTHIAMAVLLILVASLKLKAWRKWKVQDDYSHTLVQKAADEYSLAYESMSGAGQLEGQEEEKTGDRPVLARRESHGGSLHPATLPDKIEIPRSAPWPYRPERLRGLLPRLKEVLACAGRQLILRSVTKDEYCLMRAAFTLTHCIKSSSGFSFLNYVRDALEEDFSQVVGLGLPMWVFIILFVLLSSSIGWCIWIFTIISGGVLAIVNSKLIWIARYVTRGGNVSLLKPGLFWFNSPAILLAIIKFELFFVSYVYANAIFFATQFGPKSCFFSRAGFQGQPVSWYWLMVVNSIFAASLALLTLPLYSLVGQMDGNIKAAFLPEDVVTHAHRTRDLKVSTMAGFRQLIKNIIPGGHASQGDEAKDDGKIRLMKSTESSSKGA